MGSLSSLIFSIILTTAGALAMVPAYAQDADPSLVDKGHSLAIAGDCAACHRDPATDNPFAGGYGVASPLGTIFGSNITPSKTDGIGDWSLDQFSDAVRKGRVGTHYLYPAMPYTAFSGISDADIKALYSYFMLDVKPVDKKAPQTDLGFPFNIRPLMAGWDLLFGGTTPARETPQAPLARGKYLVDTFAHCSTCHTPRNELMAEDMSRYLGGGKVGSWTAPNITSDPKAGIGSWTEDQLYTYLKTGALHGQAIAAGEMGTAVQNSFSQMSDEDIHAIAAYIKSVPPVENSAATTPRSGQTMSKPAPVPVLETPVPVADYAAGYDVSKMSGAEVYEGACATCHGYDGRGTPDHKLPSLVGSSAVGSPDASNLVMTITEGVSRTVKGVHVFMPAFGPQNTAFGTQFDPDLVAKVADYVSTSFGNGRHVSTADVKLIYASATEKSWLIANVRVFIWAGVAIAVIVLGALALWISRRRHSGSPKSA